MVLVLFIYYYQSVLKYDLYKILPPRDLELSSRIVENHYVRFHMQNTNNLCTYNIMFV